MSNLALPNDLARAAMQQQALERQANAILQNLTFGIYCQLAANHIETSPTQPGGVNSTIQLNRLADAAQEAAIVMAERFGFHFSRRDPEAAT